MDGKDYFCLGLFVLFIVFFCSIVRDTISGLTFEQSIEICDNCHVYCDEAFERWQDKCDGMYDGLENICDDNLEIFNVTECHDKCWKKSACKKVTEGEVVWNE